MTSRQVRAIVTAGAAWALGAAAGQAQSLGTFTWQLQPFCNRLTVNVTQSGGLYTLDGFDDQCGAPQRAPLVGLATPNPDGTIGFGFHIATSPGGKTVSVEARISLATIGGPWTDSAGNSGTLVLNGSAAGSARPAPTVPGGTIAVGSIPGAAIAAGAIGTAQIAPGAVTSAQTSNEPGVSVTFNGSIVALFPSTMTSVVVTGVRVPADGYVKVEVSGNWLASLAGTDAGECQLQKGPTAPITLSQPYFRLTDNGTATTSSGWMSFAAHRVFPVAVVDNPVAAGAGQAFRLVCTLTSGAVALDGALISATYYATSYAPAIAPAAPPW